MTNKKISLVAIAAVAAIGTLFAAPGEARADQNSGLKIGLKTGYAIPMGNVNGSGTVNISGVSAQVDATKLSESVSGMIPIWLDVGYRINPNLYVGGFFQYGIVMVKDRTSTGKVGCPSGADCSASDIRVGANFRYYAPMGSFTPYGGVGVGYEILNGSVTANGVETTSSYSGLEFLNLQAGLDIPIASGVNIGPFISFSLGQYSSFSAKTGGAELSLDYPKAIHQWLFLGIGGSYDL